MAAIGLSRVCHEALRQRLRAAGGGTGKAVRMPGSGSRPLNRQRGKRVTLGQLSWLERTPDKGEVGSSSLPRPTKFPGAIAQLGERLLCTQEVCGSIPHSSTTFTRIEFRQGRIRCALVWFRQPECSLTR